MQEMSFKDHVGRVMRLRFQSINKMGFQSKRGSIKGFVCSELLVLHLIGLNEMGCNESLLSPWRSEYVVLL